MVKNQDQCFPVVFADMLNHSDVAKAYLAGEERRHSPGKVVSAGFVHPVTFETFGRSESLDLSPQPEDSLLIQAFFRQGEGMLMFVNASVAEGKRIGAAIAESVKRIDALIRTENES
ncbi:MAG: hypothetical protein ABS95_01170 [Verrucomicrobia bacterium SCN 57-15]|nr:MAG: hypothetical protein ABS95_01170 [Verrucomicrobia bacterium SCN 57-15]